MPVRIDVDSASAYLVPWAKKRLHMLHEFMQRGGIRIMTKMIPVSSGEMIRLNAFYLQNGVWLDKIRITAGGTPTHVFRNGTSSNDKVRVLGANGASLSLSSLLAGFSSLVGISGNGRYIFVLSGTTPAGWSGDPIYDGFTRTLYVLKDQVLYRTLTYTFPAGSDATYVGQPYDGFLNGGNLISYDGKKAIVPIAIHDTLGQGVLIFDDTAVETAPTTDPNVSSNKLRYFVTPAIISVFTLEVPYIGTPDLSSWGWFDWVAAAPDSNAVFHVINVSDVEAQTVVEHAISVCSVFSQNGTLVLGYYRVATADYVVKVGGTVYVPPGGAILYENSIAPWLVSADASVVLVTAPAAYPYVLKGGVFTALPGFAIAVSLDGSTYAHYDTVTYAVTVVRTTGTPPVTTNIPCADFWFGNGGSHITPAYLNSWIGGHSVVPLGWLPGASNSPAGVFSSDGTKLRQVGWYATSKQDLYSLNSDSTDYTGSTVTFANTGTTYDNIYSKTPVA